MPRKGGAGGGKGTKAATKAAAKVVQDKTFGMKNKNKSKKVQQYINQVKNQTEAKYVGKKRGDAEPQKTKKQLAAEKAAEFNAIFKPVVDKKAQVAAGVDPKSVLCQYFKAGTCTKGARCKFSHDTAVERKAEKIDIYTDRRDVTPDVNDTMDKWDEAKLRSVVATKAGKNPPTTTDIVCKYFLDAIEARKYGWFWECPNGGAKCQYRHALPPGFVFQAKKKKEEDEDEEEKVPLEELIEEERRGLKGGTPLTLELFLKWKEDRRIAKEKAALERENAIKAGKVTMSGRELFVYNPDLVAGDDDSAYDDAELRREKEQTEKEMLEEEERKLAEGGDFVGPVENTEEDGGRDEKAKEKEKEDDEGSTSAPEAITSEASTSGAVEVDEQLFAAEVVDDLPEFDD